jgi:hypothetical protein
MNPTKNDITGDFLITGASTDKYREGWDRIFGKKTEVTEVQDEQVAAEVVEIKPNEV